MRDVSFGLTLRRFSVALGAMLALLSVGIGSGALSTLGSVDAARPADAWVGDVSPAYLYGYTSAALTACPLQEGPAWRDFERALADYRAKNAFLEDVSRGFAAFDRDANANGYPTVCDQALNSYGARDSDSGILLTTSIAAADRVAPLRVGH